MIVTTIIVVLASLALGAYKSHVQRAKFTEVINTLAPVKLALETCYMQRGLLHICDDSIPGNGSVVSTLVNNARNRAKVPGYVYDVEVIYNSSNSIDVRVTGERELEYATFILNGLTNDNTIGWTADTENSTCFELSFC